jgi:hypothetical protein
MPQLRNNTGDPRTLVAEGVRVDIPPRSTVSISAKDFGAVKQNKHVRRLLDLGMLDELSDAKPKGPAKSKQKDVGI